MTVVTTLKGKNMFRYDYYDPDAPEGERNKSEWINLDLKTLTRAHL
jgi:hypothetical protein